VSGVLGGGVWARKWRNRKEVLKNMFRGTTFPHTKTWRGKWFVLSTVRVSSTGTTSTTTSTTTRTSSTSSTCSTTDTTSSNTTTSSTSNTAIFYIITIHLNKFAQDLRKTRPTNIPHKTCARSAQDKASTAQDSRECNFDDTVKR
jgi:hypothetical protein